jgi:hypothetical protein
MSSDTTDRIVSETKIRSALLYSLSDSRVRRPPRRSRWHVAGPMVALAIVGTLWVAVAHLIQSSLTHGEDLIIKPWIMLIWTAIGIVVLGPLRVSLVRQIRQIRATKAEEALAGADIRLPILYLRSFKMDEELAKTSWFERAGAFFVDWYFFQSAEERLAKRLRKIGPLIAIGRPDEELPTLGAARFYPMGGCWREKIRDILKAAQLVVWLSGVSDGLRWELRQILSEVAPTRLVIWAHPNLLGLNPKLREMEWQKFLAELGALFPQTLPKRLGDIHFFCFDSTFNPIPILGNEYALSSQADAINSLFVQLSGSTRSERGTWRWRSSSFLKRIVLGAVAGVVVYAIFRAYVIAALYITRPMPSISWEIAGDYVSWGYIFARGLCGALFVLFQRVFLNWFRNIYIAAILFWYSSSWVLTALLSPRWRSAISDAIYNNINGSDAAGRVEGWIRLVNNLASPTLDLAFQGLVFVALLRLMPFGPARPKPSPIRRA